MIPFIFVQNVYEMYLKISYKFQRIPDTQSRVITKVYDFLGQPSYVKIFEKILSGGLEVSLSIFACP